jgi:hypothetical protein
MKRKELESIQAESYGVNNPKRSDSGHTFTTSIRTMFCKTINHIINYHCAEHEKKNIESSCEENLNARIKSSSNFHGLLNDLFIQLITKIKLNSEMNFTMIKSSIKEDSSKALIIASN